MTSSVFLESIQPGLTPAFCINPFAALICHKAASAALAAARMTDCGSNHGSPTRKQPQPIALHGTNIIRMRKHTADGGPAYTRGMLGFDYSSPFQAVQT